MKYITESDAVEQYNEFLNEVYGEVVINRDSGLSWDASRVIEELDPTAYRCGMNDWLDSEDLTTDESEADEDEPDEDDEWEDFVISDDVEIPRGLNENVPLDESADQIISDDDRNTWSVQDAQDVRDAAAKALEPLMEAANSVDEIYCETCHDIHEPRKF